MLPQPPRPLPDRAGPLGLDDAEFGRAAVCADFDNDGDVDILLLHEGATLWENESRGANFLRIQLRGLPPNTEAVGARITVTTTGAGDTRVRMRELTLGSIDTWKAAFVRSAESFHNERGENGTVAFGSGPTYEAFALDDDAPVVQHYLSGVKARGMDPKTVSNDGGMDANWIVAHGIPTVTFGAGQRDVHTSDEWIALEDFAAACRLVTQLAEVV